MSVGLASSGPATRRLREFAGSVLVAVAKSPLVRLYSAARIRRLASSRSPVSLNLGCGSRHFQGWINVDIRPWPLGPDVLLDLERSIPLPANSVDYIFSEDFIEHIPYESGTRFLRECHRLLRPNGVLRLLTPDLKTFAKAYVDREEKDLAWYREQFGTRTFAQMFNTGMRAWGHRFLYDEETLSMELTEIGFSPERLAFNESSKPMLRGLDLRDTARGAHTMYLEARKK